MNDDFLVNLNCTLFKSTFANDSTILTIGTNSTLLITKNSGKNWRQIDLEKKWFFSDITSFQGKIYIICEDGNILTSSDLGETLLPQKITNENLSKIKFVNDIGFIWTTNSKLYISQDNGLNWNKIDYSFGNILDLFSFKNDSLLLIDNRSKIYTSKDGSKWQNINDNSINEPIHSALYLNDTIYTMSLYKLCVSYDFGKNWLKKDIANIMPNSYNIALAESPNNEPYMISTDVFDFIIQYKITPNKESVELQKVNNKCDTIYQLGNANLVSCSYNKNNAIAVGKDKTMYISADNGLNWNLISYLNTQKPKYAYFSPLQFVQDSVGFLATYYNLLFNTEDNGATWKPQENYSTRISDSTFIVKTISSFNFINRDVGFLFVPDDFTIYKTINSNKSHLPYKKFYAKNNTKVLGFEINSCLIHGYSDFNYGTNRMPRTVINYYLESNQNELEVNFLDSMICNNSQIINNLFVIVGFKYNKLEFTIDPNTGESTGVVKTTPYLFKQNLNNSKNLDTLVIPEIDIVNNLSCFDENDFFISGYVVNHQSANGYSTSYILKTTDSGKSWVKIYETEEAGITSINIDSSGLGFATLNSNYFIYTTNFGNTWKKIYYNNDYKFSQIEVTREYVYLYSEKYFFKMKNLDFQKITDVKENEIEQIEVGAPPLWQYSPKPNPCRGIIQFSLAWNPSINLTKANFSIYNEKGYLIRDISDKLSNCTNFKGDNLSIETDNLSSGLYYAVLKYDGFVKTVVFVVLH